MAQLASDNFNRANENPLANGTWTSGTGANGNLGCEVISSQCDGPNAGSENQSYWSALTWPNDQYSEADFISFGGATNMAMCLRHAAQGTNTKYFCPMVQGTSAAWQIAKYVAGTFTVLATSGTITLAANDRVKGQVQGTTLTAFQNGVSQLTATDSAIASGSAAIFSRPSNIWDNWAGGDFSLLTGGSQLDMLDHVSLRHAHHI